MPHALLRLQRQERLAVIWFLAPGLLFLLAFFFVPIGSFLSLGFLAPDLSLDHYRKAFSDPIYSRMLGLTLQTSFVTACTCACLGYPVAYVLVHATPRWRLLIFALVLIPFWTNILVRMFAWLALLGRHGVINSNLMALGLTDTSLPLLYTNFTVVLGMTHFLLPYMILACYAVMSNIPSALVDAASNLGASPRRAFWRVYFPLSLPGLAAGFLLVFIISLGFFVTPALLGPQNQKLLAQVIEIEVSDTLNWGFAAALSGILVALTVSLYALYDRLIGADRIYE